ncbi:serine/threonine-protein kinase [Salinibacterium sp. G-O1]|uniref:serine/threonine-protein kinase n=1 Tax=Salinibacterium sp. G-O1 TaxID=3046208 RepID=UPI0024B98F3B|nr:serine/threonine-protein kinase [Salinibacterium sp. G-O1]MDJ0334699.1 serine/threonine-protein kinase [Salinibacterium sp. G-O1]
MARRLPSSPPILPGFSHIHVLGSGGFADVFLYEQNMPRRQVAVKVMLSEIVNDQVRQMFQAEANLMAQLSAHPSILTVYQASVSSDGRPYLVMELCSSSLSQRYRTERLPVAEVLRIAVKIGSALETANRAGVLHRDIKPSNILTTAYGNPVLSDFGIAATLGESESFEAVGMSIPWSAPEVLMDETAGTVQSEVWAFAATTYSLLAGRSPFEIPGGSNKSTDLISRINRAKPQPIGRGDVPASLERALIRGMSRKPEARQSSVIELVHELQAIESEMGLAQTAVESVIDEWALATVSDLEDRTRVRGGASPAASISERRRRRRGTDDSAPYAGVDTMARDSRSSPRVTGTGAAGRPRPTRGLMWAAVATATVLVLGLIIALAVLFTATGKSTVPTVSNIQATVVGGTVTFSWQDPGINDADSYRIVTADGQSSIQRSPEFTYDSDPGERVCITVTVNREGKDGPASGEKCVDIPA